MSDEYGRPFTAECFAHMCVCHCWHCERDRDEEDELYQWRYEMSEQDERQR